MNVFEKILLRYGGFVLANIREIFKERQEYERCIEINDIMLKYRVSTNMSLEDWQAEFWRTGLSGETAKSNVQRYIENAIRMCREQGLLTKYKNK
nr:MAG TPA: hypothetical protein [Caudoviricetes sp.]